MFRSVHSHHWYPNVNIQIDPFATLVPTLPNVNIRIDPFATLVPKLPNVNIPIDPFATLVPKCQYSDRIHSQSGWLGPQSEYNHLAGAAIRTRNHNYEDRNYDLNAHPHFLIQRCRCSFRNRTGQPKATLPHTFLHSGSRAGCQTLGVPNRWNRAQMESITTITM